MKKPSRFVESTAEAEHHRRETAAAICVSATEDTLLLDDGRVGALQTILGGVGGEEDGEEEAAVGVGDGASGLGEKKRRLGVHQVSALEKSFEVENKLEPERKVKLARELGLQPRQVAVWFQNRRARWKIKQLERDYGFLKTEYDSLKLLHQTLRRDNEALLLQIDELKAKVGGDETTVKEEVEEKKAMEVEEDAEESLLPPLIYKDGSSDSDTSAILNEEGVSGISSSSTQNLRQPNQNPVVSMDVEDGENKDGRGIYFYYQYNQQQEVEHEEHDFLNGSGSIFSDEDPPTLSWYCSN